MHAHAKHHCAVLCCPAGACSITPSTSAPGATWPTAHCHATSSTASGARRSSTGVSVHVMEGLQGVHGTWGTACMHACWCWVETLHGKNEEGGRMAGQSTGLVFLGMIGQHCDDVISPFSDPISNLISGRSRHAAQTFTHSLNTQRICSTHTYTHTNTHTHIDTHTHSTHTYIHTCTY